MSELIGWIFLGLLLLPMWVLAKMLVEGWQSQKEFDLYQREPEVVARILAGREKHYTSHIAGRPHDPVRDLRERVEALEKRVAKMPPPSTSLPSAVDDIE